jgi:anti-sigma-K factor RskA
MSKPLQLPAMAQGDLEYVVHLLNMEEARLGAQLRTCADDKVNTLIEEWEMQCRIKDAIYETLEGGPKS